MRAFPSIPTPVVTVVVPAYNAQATLAETLDSALAQTCRDIEVIVVDDGSSDQTAGLVAAYAARDARVRLIEQSNGGVARARNTGIAEARGAFVAPLDADDLWRPDKLERQLKALQAAGPNVGLAYTWSLLIDPDGNVTGAMPPAQFEGYVLHRHLAWNFIGNGSTPLVPTELLRRHPYEPALRDAQCEGGEDYLMQLQLARRYGFACAPAYLVGYRKVPGSMSSQGVAMNRSVSSVFAHLEADLTGLARSVAKMRRSEYLAREAGHHLTARDWGKVARTLLEAGLSAPGVTAEWLWDRALKRFSQGGDPWPTGAPWHFYGRGDEDPPAVEEPKIFQKMKSRLESADRSYSPSG
jgi:glycosyltransferase involved in cell wall biosynthesis